MAGLLDLLSSIIGKPQQPLGSGLAQQAANTDQLYKQWQALAIQAQEQGQQFPEFHLWAQQYKDTKPVVLTR